MIHGFNGSKDNWLSLAYELGDKYHIIIPDLIGNGASSKPKNISYSIDEQTRLLHSFLKKLHLKRTILIANSMGGAISLNYVYMYKHINILILIDSLGIKSEDSYVDKMGVEKIRESWLHVCTPQKLQALIAQGIEDPPYIPNSILTYLSEEKCLSSDFEEKKCYDILDKKLNPLDDLTQKAKDIKIPTLIIWGKKDKILSYKNSYAFHSTIEESELVILENIGHVPMIEDASQVSSKIVNFLNKHQK